MRLGIFGGAFNPIHNGHLALARSYYKSLRLDRVLFVPTAVPPHKTSEYLAPAKDRINMTRIAIADEPAFEVCDIEFYRSGKSYTYDTLLSLRGIYPDSEFFLIIGADQFLSFHEWYRYKDILDMVTVCTSARQDENEKKKLFDYADSRSEMKGKYYIASYPVIRISSSDIRYKVKNNIDISAVVPQNVCEYIKQRGLYSV